MLFAAGVASVWTLGAGARTQALPHFTMTSSQFSAAGACSQGHVTLSVTGGASSTELGRGSFQSAVDLTFTGGAVAYRETFTATFGTTVVRGSTTGTGTGACPQGTAGGTFSTAISSPEPGAGTSVVTIGSPDYSHTFTPSATPAATSTAATATTTTTTSTTTVQTTTVEPPTTTAAPTTSASSTTTPATTTPLPRVSASVATSWSAHLTFTKNTKLAVKHLTAGSQVQLACTGTGCPFTAKSFAVKKAGTLTLTKAVASAKLWPGTDFDVRVTHPAAIGKVVRYTMRAGKQPTFVVLCLPPGASAPSACS